MFPKQGVVFLVKRQTTFDYADSWGGSGCVTAASTFAFPTTVTNAKTQRNKTSYFPCTSLVQSTKDENDIVAGRSGTTSTYDQMNRPLCTQKLDNGGQILARSCWSYNDSVLPLSITKTVTGAPSPDVVSTVIMDGFGRTAQAILNDPEGNVTSEITYDALGRKASATNPHRSVVAATDGTTQYSYDTLGRTTDVIKQDGNKSHTDYAGNVSTVTDETGRQRRSRMDGAGRLVEVDEPGDAFSGAAANGSVNISGSLGSALAGGSTGQQAIGSITIAGSEASRTYPGDRYCADFAGTRCVDWEFTQATTVYDSGTMTVYVNGQPFTYTYGGSDSVSTIANTLASSIRANSPTTDYTSVVVNTGAIPPTASISLVAKTTGTAGNGVTLGTGASSYDTTDFTVASFAPSVSGATLTGGLAPVSPTTVYDAGTVTLSVGGLTATANYGNSAGQDNSGASLAADLVAKIKAQLPTSNPAFSLSVPLNSTTISIQFNVLGPQFTSITSATTQTGNFSLPSFSAGCTMSSNPQACNVSLGGSSPIPSSLASPYITLYSYDALGNLFCVEQHGNASGTGCSSSPASDATSPWRVRRFTYDSLSRLLTAKNPESGTTTYQYDNDGNMISKVDGRGIGVTFGYEQLHRLTIKQYSDGSAPREYYYDVTPPLAYSAPNHGDSIGRLTHASNDVNAAYDPVYDPLGRVTAQVYCIPSNCANFNTTVSASYDAAGAMTSLTYPDGRKVTSTYSSAGRMTGVTLASFSGNLVNVPYYTVPQGTSPSNWGYWPTGAMNRGTYGNGVIETTGYNNRMQVSSIADAKGATNLFSKTYNYADSSGNNNGNILSIADVLSSTRNQTFSYDSLNRIATGSQADNAFNITYSYDAWGNMKESGTSNFQPAYDLSNRIQSPPNCSPVAQYCYDAAGDLLIDNKGHAYTYDAESRIKAVDGAVATYTYGPDGERVRKDVNGVGTEYVYFQGNRDCRKKSQYWCLD